MATDPDKKNNQVSGSPWLGVARFVFLVLFVAMLFLLTRSMVRHHFFSGGQLNRRDGGP
jgi:hypothetical protein